jgi:hypothetical protein
MACGCGVLLFPPIVILFYELDHYTFDVELMWGIYGPCFAFLGVAITSCVCMVLLKFYQTVLEPKKYFEEHTTIGFEMLVVQLQGI